MIVSPNAATDPPALARALRELTSPEMVGHISSLVGEPRQSTLKACEASLIALVSSVSNLASGMPGPSSIAAWLERGGCIGVRKTELREILANTERAESVGRAGSEVARAIFGRGLPRVTESVRNQAGMKASSAASILALMAAIFAATLEEARRRDGLDESGLLKLVRRQQSLLSDLFPPVKPGKNSGTPLSQVSRLSGIGGSLFDAAARLGGAPSQPAAPAAKTRGNRSRWRLWAVGTAALALVIAAGTYLKSRSRVAGFQPSSQTQAILPNGVILRNPVASVSQLTGFLATPALGELPKRFVLNQVAFYRDSNRMKPESADTIDQLAAVFKAYPALAARIEGHSELSGDRKLEQRLALDRGNAVKARIEALGADVSRVETEGFVADKALDSSAPLAEHEKANRTEIVLTSVR